MKILQVSTGFDIGFNGGITNYVRNLSEELMLLGNDVAVLDSQKKAGNTTTYPFKNLSIQTELAPAHLSSVISNNDTLEIEQIVKELLPDVIHVHMMIDLPAEVLGVFKKYSKVVISLHDYSHICNRIALFNSRDQQCTYSNENRVCNTCIPWEETIDNRLVRGVLKKAKSLLPFNIHIPSSGHHDRFVLTRGFFKEADAVIAVSTRVREIYIENGFTNNKFIVNHIGNYTADNDFRAYFKNRPHIGYEKPIRFGFIGTLSKIKGADIFLKLVEGSKHEFNVYGNIAVDVMDKIKRCKNVFYHGKYSHADLPDILKNLDFGLVLPIWEDNAPQVVFEFLNAGIPVLGTKMGGVPDFVNEKNGKLIENSPMGIMEAKEFINSKRLYDTYNGLVNNIVGTKTGKQHATEILELYKSL